MSLLAGMGKAYANQRAHTTQLEDEEANLRRLAEMRANDEQYNYAKGMDRNLQVTRANRGVNPQGLPDPVDVPGYMPTAPATAAPAPAAKPIVQQSKAYGAMLPQAQPTENQSAAESKRLASKPLPVEQDNRGRPLSATYPGRQLSESATARERFAELQRMNQQIAPPNQTNAETARLLRGAPPAMGGAAAPSGPITQEQLAQAIYGQESNYGRANTAGINYAGATGPMQVTADTFEGLKRNGVIPPDYVHTNPEHNMAAGRALIGQLWNQYGGDASKVAAAYYSGPKAVQPDGTIRDFRDPRNPNAPTTSQYVAQVLERVGQSAPAQPSTAPSPATTPAAQPVAANAVPPIIPRDMFLRVSAGAQQREQMLMLRNQELREELKFTRDPDKQLQLLAQMEATAADVYETRVLSASAAAGSGDMRAMSQLAQAAGVSIAQGQGGTVVIVAPQPDGTGRPTATLPPGQAAAKLYALISPRIQAARAAAQQKVLEQQAQGQREIAVENVRGENSRQVALINAQSALQKVLAEAQAKNRDVKQIISPDLGRNGIVSIDGQMFEVIPGATIDGMQTETTLRPVRQ